MTGRVSFLEEPLYQYVIRPDSLSHSPSSGVRSPIRIMTKQQLAAMYREAFEHYRGWMRRTITSAQLNERIRELSRRFVTPQLREAVEFETERLASVLRAQPAIMP